MIKLVPWPAKSPNLNHTKTIWLYTNQYIQLHHPSLSCRGQVLSDVLRPIVKEAWDCGPTAFISRLIKSMRKRYLAVIDANKSLAKY